MRLPKQKHTRTAGSKTPAPSSAIAAADRPEAWEPHRAHEAESLVLIRALEVFGDGERALQWLREANPALKNETPIRVIQTAEGQREVINILGRIQHGVIS
jgi:putative toxin-antitoxin system antitoxin component (TIGR02293 family)